MKLIEGKFTVEIDRFKNGVYVYEIKKPKKLVIKLAKNGIYSTVLNFGGTGKYKNIEINQDTYDRLCCAITEMLYTLYKESKDLNNNSKRDKWFRENVREYKLELMG